MSELRKLFDESVRGEKIERAKMVNAVDPEAFNYSLEEPIVRHYGSYLDFDQPWSFSLIQPFIRSTDFSELVRGNARRQSLFDVGAIRFALDPDSNRRQELHRLALGELVQFLTEEVGLDQDLFVFTVFGGGSLVEAAKNSGREINLIDPSLYFPPDTETEAILRELGFRDEQIIRETNLDTFLAEFPVPIEAWAGYRSEIYYDDPEPELGRLEIGTDESLDYRRVIWSDEETQGPKTSLSMTKDIVPHQGTFAASGVGLDRILMVVNGLATPYECDHIAPVYELVNGLSKALYEQEMRVLTDALRVLHLVVADGFDYADLPTKHIKNQWRTYARQLDRCAGLLRIIDKDLIRLGEINAAAQPWYPELQAAIPQFMAELTDYRQRAAKSGGF